VRELYSSDSPLGTKTAPPGSVHKGEGTAKPVPF
jgi:hypothetical protein